MSEITVSFTEVLAAARLGRARIAPETAGYLALGVADASARQRSSIEEDNCLIAEDGSILLGPSRSGGDKVESSLAIRHLLGSFLEVARGGGGGGATLASIAKREAPSDSQSLIAEIEAALIPVNRAAARRALARLARETAKARDAGQLAESMAPPPVVEAPPTSEDETTDPAQLPPQAVAGEPRAEAGDAREPAPEPPPMSQVRAPSSPPPAGKTRADELLARFSGTVAESEEDIARELKAIAGLDPTPPPPVALPVDEPASDPSPPVDEPAEPAPVESLDVEEPFDFQPHAARSRAGVYLLSGLLFLGIAATVATWIYYPELFTGR